MRTGPAAVLLAFALAGCTSGPGRVYVLTPRHICDQLADDDHGRLGGAPADAGAMVAQLPWKAGPEYRYRWYEQPDGGRIVCIFHPDDGCSPATHLFRLGATGWTHVPDAGRELVCTADTRIDR
jgi:hypothetical protein